MGVESTGVLHQSKRPWLAVYANPSRRLEMIDDERTNWTNATYRKVSGRTGVPKSAIQNRSFCEQYRSLSNTRREIKMNIDGCFSFQKVGVSNHRKKNIFPKEMISFCRWNSWNWIVNMQPGSVLSLTMIRKNLPGRIECYQSWLQRRVWCTTAFESADNRPLWIDIILFGIDHHHRRHFLLRIFLSRHVVVVVV